MKILKKSDITNLIESTMKEVGMSINESVVTEDTETPELDVVEESVKNLVKESKEDNIITENISKELESFKRIINFKH